MYNVWESMEKDKIISKVRWNFYEVLSLINVSQTFQQFSLSVSGKFLNKQT